MQTFNVVVGAHVVGNMITGVSVEAETAEAAAKEAVAFIRKNKKTDTVQWSYDINKPVRPHLKALSVAAADGVEPVPAPEPEPVVETISAELSAEVEAPQIVEASIAEASPVSE